MTRDHGLGHSPASGPGAQPIPENRFVPKERILHPRLERGAGLLLPAAPAERPHVRDRAISRARPRPTPRHPRGLGRWNHDWVSMEAFSPTGLKDAAGAGDWCTAGLIDNLARGGVLGFRNITGGELKEAVRFGQALAGVELSF